VFGGKGEAAIAKHLHDPVDHVSVRQQSQQLASDALMPYSVVGYFEIDRYSAGIASSKPESYSRCLVSAG